MRRPLACLALCLVLVAGLPARAEDEPAPAPASEQEIREQVATWLQELAADDFEVREAARAGLQRLGLKARDLLEAVQEAEDPEVRRTVRAILAAAGGASITRPAARPGDFLALGRVGLSVPEAPLADVLAALGRPVGATFELPAEAAEQRATLVVKDEPFFQALDTVLRGQTLRLSAPFDLAGRATVATLPDGFVRPPRAAFGPAQLSVVEVSATRTFGGPAPPRYAIKLQLDWAPFVQVAQYEMPNIEVARDPEGRAYVPTAAMSRRVSYGVGGNRKSHVVTVHVEPADVKAAPRLAVLELSLPVTLRHDLAVVDFDLSKPLPVTLAPDGKEVADGTDGSVRIESLQEVPGTRGQWVVELVATLHDAIAQRTLQTYVLDADGRVSRLGVYGGRSRSADGTLRITARAYRGDRGRPEALRIVWFRQENFGTLRFRLEDIPLR